jgi:hypothetical protein
MILASDGYNVIGRRRDYAGRHISESVSVKNSSRIASLFWLGRFTLWCFALVPTRSTMSRTKRRISD